MPNANDLSELGTTGLQQSGGIVTEEFLSSLQGQRGRAVYTEMRDNDPIVGSSLAAIDKIIGKLEWQIVPGQADTPPDQVEFVQQCLDDMSQSWDATLTEVMSMLPYGWAFHELVYKRRQGEGPDPSTRSAYTDGKIGWRKWPIRSQTTLSKWLFGEDGGLEGMEQGDPNGTGLVPIPMQKALLFRTTTAKANPEGRSALRNAVRPWTFKRRIEEYEAIGIERDLAGLPIAWVPPAYLSSDATDAEKEIVRALQTIVTGIKRNEQEGVIFPAMWDADGNKVMDLTLLSSGGTRQFDTDKVIARYDQRIAMTFLTDFLLLGHEQVGSFALGSSKMDLFTMSIEAIAKSIAEVVNTHAIPRLLTLNGMPSDRPPVLSYGEVAHVDLTELADWVSKMQASGLIVPDDQLEDWVRQVAGLPAKETV